MSTSVKHIVETYLKQPYTLEKDYIVVINFRALKTLQEIIGRPINTASLFSEIERDESLLDLCLTHFIKDITDDEKDMLFDLIGVFGCFYVMSIELGKLLQGRAKEEEIAKSTYEKLYPSQKQHKTPSSTLKTGSMRE